MGWLSVECHLELLKSLEDFLNITGEFSPILKEDTLNDPLKDLISSDKKSVGHGFGDF